ncbi:hypothetical protein [Paraburkholderia largidicola]|uniref:Uncharacterized protein n=1 Tax=Paraburkholderia largidicola TaxID=3014751 RepID=A0A7I8BKJ0_9BURK|nr:hypothetical protein [Paraburkholderia sp. PGU16]BCF88701.1 hypothetical protein PPGU16_17680 [Paraburkholderia sp. PGU16]
MNVKPGDRAHVVGTGTVNDGAIVRVLRLDGVLSFACAEPIWLIEGNSMLGFKMGPLMIPIGVVSEAVAPDRVLQRIDDADPANDTREPVELADPVTDPETVCRTI